jgi:hypothetical protein
MIEGVYDDVELMTEESMMLKVVAQLVLSCCCGGGGVDAVGAPRAVAAAEAGR